MGSSEMDSTDYKCCWLDYVGDVPSLKESLVLNEHHVFK